MKGQTLRSKVLDVYGLSKSNSQEYTIGRKKRDNVGKLVNRRLSKQFPNRTWDELTELEKDTFVYLTIRETMLEKYIDKSKHKTLRRKLDEYVAKKMLVTQLEIDKHNAAVNKIFYQYYEASATEEEKQRSYEAFSQDFKRIAPEFPIPSFEEWLEENKNNPLRIYDYLMSSSETDNGDYVLTESAVDHIILKTLLKILSEKNGIKIDVPSIKECLTYIDNFEAGDFENIPTELDPKSDIPEERQNEIIQAYHAYYKMKRKLDNLDFII